MTKRVYDLGQGRSSERLDGHARITPLPTKLFTPGQRVFTPRYRLFIPSSTNLPPAVMLRFDGSRNAAWARPLDCRFGCRVTAPGRLEIIGTGFRHKDFRYAARQAAIRSGGRTSGESKTSSVKTLRSNGFWLMRKHRGPDHRRAAVRPCSVLPRRQGLSTTGVSACVSQRSRRMLGGQSRLMTMPLAQRRAIARRAGPYSLTRLRAAWASRSA